MPHHFKEIPSTQTFLKQLVQSEPSVKNLEYAIADSQTGGLGRQGRSWISDSGNLFLSVYLRDFSLPLTWIPHWVGVSLIQSLTDLGIPGARLSLKWPNDLMVDKNQKAGGILCEKVGEGVIAGIGVNLVSAPELSDRETASIHALVPDLHFSEFHLKLKDKILKLFENEPSLTKLKSDYEKVSLLKKNMSLEWMDLQTKASGHGLFLRYGEFGELIVSDSGKERALYSEEVKLKLAK